MRRLIPFGALICATALCQIQSGTYHCLTDDAPINEKPGEAATVIFDAKAPYLEIDLPSLNVKGQPDTLLLKSTGETTYHLPWGASFSPSDDKGTLYVNQEYACQLDKADKK